MARATGRTGYTLVEVVVAVVVFGVGVLALAASTGIIARAMATNDLRERGGRIAASRIELIQSECGAASSGEARSLEIYSRWVVARPNPSEVSLEESVTYPAWAGLKTDTYRAIVWCP